MNVFVRILVLATILALVVAAGCSDRGTNNPPPVTIAEGGPLLMTHVFFNELILQIKNQFQILEMVAYEPRVSFPPSAGGELRPVPLLILLPPQGKDHYFYFNHGLQQIADELIAKGEIQPMLIACVSNDLVFGGYFFAGHFPGAGDWDAIVGQNLIDHIESFGLTIVDPDKRGIGGVGMGAYGAFRAAMLNPGTFTSVSAVDGPLDFDGSDGNSGLIDLFGPALTEQGLLGQATWNDDFDSASVWPTSNLLIGGALAFSPHDTALTLDITMTINGPIVEILARDTIADETTLIRNVVTQDATTVSTSGSRPRKKPLSATTSKRCLSFPPFRAGEDRSPPTRTAVMRAIPQPATNMCMICSRKCLYSIPRALATATSVFVSEDSIEPGGRVLRVF
jgi:hypothetical protein